jgi:hypothetical protein
MNIGRLSINLIKSESTGKILWKERYFDLAHCNCLIIWFLGVEITWFSVECFNNIKE